MNHKRKQLKGKNHGKKGGKRNQITTHKSVRFTKANTSFNNIHPDYKQSYFIQHFLTIYNTTAQEIFSNAKMEFRYFCFRYLDNIRKLTLLPVQLNNTNEAVLVEYRCFPHIEFLIRNCIHKLGVNWSHTIICGNLNYTFVKNICNNIDANIKIINTGHDNMTQRTYSDYVATIDFWNLLVGQKILLYQEDSCIFTSNIHEFLHWDYIGAPWLCKHPEIPTNVGNGGFSLRTKQCMIDVINHVSIQKTYIPHKTLVTMKRSFVDNCPEDIYFSYNISKHNIGVIADFDSGMKFSSESITHINGSLGGHNFWLSDHNWRQRIYTSCVE